MFHLWVGKIPRRRACQPTPGFLPGKSHGQTGLVSYSLWGLQRVRHDLATGQAQDSALLESSRIFLKMSHRGVRNLEFWSANSNSHGLSIAPEALPGYLAKQTSKNRDIQGRKHFFWGRKHSVLSCWVHWSRGYQSDICSSHQHYIQIYPRDEKAWAEELRSFTEWRDPLPVKELLQPIIMAWIWRGGRRITKRSVTTSTVLILFACTSPPLAGFTVLWRWYKHTNKSLEYGSLNNNIW